MTNISNRLRDLRKEKKLKQRQVADYLGISQQAYSYYEQNKRELPAQYVIKIAELYNVSTDYILGTAPRRAGNFDLNSDFLQDIPLKHVLLGLDNLDKNNRQNLIHFLAYLNSKHGK